MAIPRPEDVAALVRSSAADGVWLPVDGLSMLPTISAGSQVRVVSRSRRPRIAEIWAFCDLNGAIVVHRYRRRDEAGRLIFRGDNVLHHDTAVDPARLIGAVTSVRTEGTTRRFGKVGRARWMAGRLIARLSR